LKTRQKKIVAYNNAAATAAADARLEIWTPAAATDARLEIWGATATADARLEIWTPAAATDDADAKIWVAIVQ
jgi:adenylosuccinate lyase